MAKHAEITIAGIAEEDWREAERLAARIDAGEEAVIPLDVVRRILVEDEPPLRVFREWRGLTLNDLATETGLSLNELRALDAAKALSAQAAEAIAPILDIPPDLLQA